MDGATIISSIGIDDPIANLFKELAMSQEKAILVSDAKPMSRIVRETNAGRVFKSNDENDFADKIFELSQTNESFGQNGRSAVETKYNWSIDSKELIKLYESLNRG